MKLLAIDPASYKTGIAIFEEGVLTKTKTLSVTIKAEQLRRATMGNLIAHYTPLVDVIASECPAIQGQGGIGMNRILGMIELLSGGEVKFFYPSTVKAQMGHGGKDKLEVALAAGRMLKTHAEQDILADAVAREAWDETDAVAIGLTYYMKQGIQ